MSDTPWTPGPWTICTPTQGYEVCTIHGVENMPTENGLGQTWCYIQPATLFRDGECYWPDATEQTANARLIAAAPDMAEALDAVDRMLSEPRKYNAQTIKAQVRAALVKARGAA